MENDNVIFVSTGFFIKSETSLRYIDFRDIKKNCIDVDKEYKEYILIVFENNINPNVHIYEYQMFLSGSKVSVKEFYDILNNNWISFYKKFS